MSNYSYKAKNQYNEIIQGSINAQNITDAAVKLENQGYVVLEIKEFNEIKKHYVSSSFKNYNNSLKPFSLQEKKDFISSFYSLYKSGLSVNEIFSSILNSSKNPNIKEFCARISHKTEKGYSLKEAIKNNRNILGNAYTALICAGEESGKLDKVLNNLIRNLEREEEIKNKIISAVSYPIFIIVGGEKRGISPYFLQNADSIVKINYKREFNAALSTASAASVLAFEILRQNS